MMIDRENPLLQWLEAVIKRKESLVPSEYIENTREDAKRILELCNELEQLIGSLCNRGIDVKTLYNMDDVGGYTTDDQDVLHFFELIHELQGHPLARIVIDGQLDWGTTMTNILYQATGEQLDAENANQVPKKLEGTNCALVIIVDAESDNEIGTKHMGLFAGSVRALQQHRGVRVAVYKKGQASIPNEMANSLQVATLRRFSR